MKDIYKKKKLVAAGRESTFNAKKALLESIEELETEKLRSCAKTREKDRRKVREGLSFKERLKNFQTFAYLE